MGDLKHDHKGRPIFLAMPRRMELMEEASSRLWECLKRVTVEDIKSLRPTGPFIPLIEALLACRVIMGDDPPTMQQIEDLARRQHDLRIRRMP